MSLDFKQNNKEKIENLRQAVTKASSNPKFIHHEWFVDWHLNIVEKISLELCERHREADRELVLALVWLHDYPKIIAGRGKKEHDPKFAQEIISPLLKSIGFEDVVVNKVLSYLKIFESKMTEDLSKSPLEVQIVSSADGASHLFGPFFSIHWKENSARPSNELMESNRQKLIKDWERKIVLPEIKESIKDRFKFQMETYSGLPERFL